MVVKEKGNKRMKVRKFIAVLTLLMGVVSMQAQRPVLSPSSALKLLEIRDGRCQAKNLHAFVTLTGDTDLPVRRVVVVR